MLEANGVISAFQLVEIPELEGTEIYASIMKKGARKHGMAPRFTSLLMNVNGSMAMGHQFQVIPGGQLPVMRILILRFVEKQGSGI
jgi:hypothetical protein